MRSKMKYMLLIFALNSGNTILYAQPAPVREILPEQDVSESHFGNIQESLQSVFEFSEVLSSNQDQRQRAVAFHSIIFIDSAARVIDEIILGTAEANAIQGEGWFENEYSAEAGSFQWAGGTAKQDSYST